MLQKSPNSLGSRLESSAVLSRLKPGFESLWGRHRLSASFLRFWREITQKPDSGFPGTSPTVPVNPAKSATWFTPGWCHERAAAILACLELSRDRRLAEAGSRQPSRLTFVLCPTCRRNMDTYRERMPPFQSSPIRVRESEMCCSKCALAQRHHPEQRQQAQEQDGHPQRSPAESAGNRGNEGGQSE